MVEVRAQVQALVRAQVLAQDWVPVQVLRAQGFPLLNILSAGTVFFPTVRVYTLRTHRRR